MKKLLCVVLVLMFALSGLAFADEDNSFEPPLTNAMGLSAEEWYSTTTNRALLTVLLLLETSSSNGADQQEIINALDHTSYLGRSGNIFVAGGVFDGHQVMVTYDPGLGRAYYMVTESDLGIDQDIVAVANTLARTCEDGCAENDQSEIVSVTKKLIEIFEGSED